MGEWTVRVPITKTIDDAEAACLAEKIPLQRWDFIDERGEPTGNEPTRIAVFRVAAESQTDADELARAKVKAAAAECGVKGIA
jgi:hypothetical protein